MKPKFIDTHTHVTFKAYGEDREVVIQRAIDAGVWMINVGTQQDTSQAAVDLAEKYDEGVYAIIGLHPIHTTASYHDEKELGTEGGKGFNSRGEIFDKDFYRNLAKSKKVVGLGETGLDYFHLDQASLEVQKKAFQGHIELAIELDLPLMIHSRPTKGSVDAYKDILDILESYKKQYGEKLRGNAHFFAGDIETAKRFLDIGFTMSFTGVVTFARNYDELLKFVPLDMMHAETDAPYVTPEPYRGQRNEPSYVQEVVKKIAEIKGEDIEKVKEQLMKNAKRLYRI